MGSGRNSTKNLYFAQILPAISFQENFDILLEEMLANSGKAYPGLLQYHTILPSISTDL